MVLNYNGVLYSYYVGGELKRPGSTYIWASVISIALLIVVWVGVWLLMVNTIGLDFMQAQAQVGTNDAANYGAITSLQANAGGLGYGLVLSGDPITKIFIGFAVPAAELAVDLAFVAVVTRVMFAHARHAYPFDDAGRTLGEAQRDGLLDPRVGQPDKPKPFQTTA